MHFKLEKNKRYGIYLTSIIFLALALLVAPYIIRFFNNNPFIIGSESYKFLNSESSSHLLNNIYSLIDAKVAISLTIILGLFCIFLFYSVLKNYDVSEKIILISLLLLVTSPIYLTVFTTINAFSITIFLVLLMLLFYSLKLEFISLCLALIIPFVEFYGAIFTAVVLLFYWIMRSDKKVFYVLGALIFSTINYIIFFNIPPIMFDASNVLVELGSVNSWSFSIILLSIIGLILLWDKGLKNTILFFSINAFLILAIFIEPLRIYLTFILVVYSGFALMYLHKRKWSIQIIKKATTLLIICSILFSTLFFITFQTRSTPNNELVDAIKFIDKQSDQKYYVLSSADLGFFINYFSNSEAYLNNDNKNSLNYKLENISKSRNLRDVESFFNENNIKYVVIDEDFRLYLEQKEGLLFVIETSNKFFTIYKNKDVKVLIYSG